MSDETRHTLGVNRVYVWPWLGAIQGSVKMESVCMYRLMHAKELLYIGPPASR